MTPRPACYVCLAAADRTLAYAKGNMPLCRECFERLVKR
jgi:hypothetical protein